MRLAPLLALTLAVSPAPRLAAQLPVGLAASALADSSFQWIPRRAPGFRAYFLADSYPARHQDSLLARLPVALAHAQRLIGGPPLADPIDLFFLETRDQMGRLTGARVTGFPHAAARTVFLVTNPTWRAFERHEIMHVVARQLWGPPAPNTDWLVEGLAQAADGRCASHSNADVVLALTARHGWIPLETLLTAFRSQPDLRGYLQAAAFVDYLLSRVGASALHHLWRGGATPDTVVGGVPLKVLEAQWHDSLTQTRHPTSGQIARIEATGCG